MSQSAARKQQERQPAADQASQGLVVWEGFSGLNTQPSRYGIGDQECFIMDGFFPSGNSNARVIPDNGPPVYFTDGDPNTNGSPIVFFDFGNIGSTPYALVFFVNGGIVSVNTTTGMSNPIAAAGTILNPAQGNIAVSQWGSKYILIVANQPNGYFIWDGSVFYEPGNVIPGIDGPGPIDSSVLLAGGSGYAVGDTGTVTGGINDATYVVTSINETGNGSGYAIGDTGSVGGGAGDALYVINTVDGSGAVTGMHLTATGSNYLTAKDVPTFTGGGQPGIGTGLTIDITVNSPPGPISGFVISAVGVVTGYSITSPGTEYVPGTAGTATGGAQPGVGINLLLSLVVTSATVPTGIMGTAIETYQSRVWITNGASFFGSAPESFTDFATSDGGIAFVANDSTLRVRYTQLKQSNGYLYLFGDSSISYIAGVQTTGSPPTTSFSLQNVDPEVGTAWPDTVDLLGSNIVFANAWGAHVSFGGRAAKVSPELDGTYNSAPNFAGITPSAAKTILFGKRVWMLLLPVIDPYTGQLIAKLFIWDEKRWCSAQQTSTLRFIKTQEIDSVLTAWGTDSNELVRLFVQPNTNLLKVMRSKFWAPQSLFFGKAEERIAGVATVYSGPDPVITVCLDSENGSSCTPITLKSPQLIWYQDSLLPGDPTPSTGAISTARPAAAGAGYAVGDTGSVLGGNGDATYEVLTVDGTGGVLTIDLVLIGTGYATGTAATAVGGSQPGAGAGLTLTVVVGIVEVLPWINNAVDPLIWTGTGNNVVVFPPTGDVAQNGALIGFTVSTFAADLALSSIQTIPASVQGRF